MAIVLGLDCKLYRGTAGSTANILMSNVKDVTMNLTKATADITTRKANGWRVQVGTLKEASLEFEMLYDPADADCQAIMDAYLNNTPISFFVSDGSGNGLDADFSINDCNQGQALEEGVTFSVTATPTDIGASSGRAPSWNSNGPSA